LQNYLIPPYTQRLTEQKAAVGFSWPTLGLFLSRLPLQHKPQQLRFQFAELERRVGHFFRSRSTFEELGFYQGTCW